MIKLHLGAGYERLEGYTNIDIRLSPSIDIICDCTNLPMYENNSVDEICAFHLIEHFTFKEFRRAILEWWRILKPEGSLILECPDLEKICIEFAISDDKKRFWSFNGGPALVQHIYGGQSNPYDFHKMGFTKSFLEHNLSSLFKDFVWGKSHKDYKIPCISLSCIKKEIGEIKNEKQKNN